MSGIYIPGVQMPKTCYDCLFQDDEYFGSIKCRYAKTWGSYSSRAVDCPLIPVPDHGRLIDADALDKAIGEEVHECAWDNASFSGYRVWDLLDDAPTIIPADKEGEE